MPCDPKALGAQARRKGVEHRARLVQACPQRRFGHAQRLRRLDRSQPFDVAQNEGLPLCRAHFVQDEIEQLTSALLFQQLGGTEVVSRVKRFRR